jgi:energy-coupling factor transporter ATP-binding protein EcfA2
MKDMTAESDPTFVKLQFGAVHGSIDHVPIDALPPFSLITGQNGCGKTHFLQALAGGQISIEGIPQSQVQYYSWQSFAPRNNSLGGRVPSQGPAHWASLQNSIRLASEASNNTGRRALGRTLLQLIELWHSAPDKRPDVDPEVRRFSLAIKQQLPPRIQQLLSSFETDTGTPCLCITQDEFYDRVPLVIAEMDPSQGSVAELFAAYISALEQNDLIEVRARRGAKGLHLSQEDFVRKYGPPPWDVVNRVLAEARLDYRVDTPSEDPERSVSAVLRKPGLQAALSFDSLSSGEKILMSLALCMFFLKDARQPVRIPSMLLFDEVDAFLHPEMSGAFLAVVNRVLVGDYKRHVVIVTHSPSTVAQAPSGSVLVMDGPTRNLRHATIDEGIAALTVGVPTLSVRLENRRQVFVESDNDVRVWERCCQYTKSFLRPGISLSFVASGAPSHAGCARVKDSVRHLRAGGNRTIAGIVDWDLANEPDEGLFVIGYGKRYSIENYLLDPVLLGALLIRDKTISKAECGLREAETYVDMRAMDAARLQTIADRILELLGYAGGDRETCRYVNGRELQIPTLFLRTRGHDLEEQIREVFPPLRRFSQEPLLKLEILEKVVDDLSGLLPSDLVDVLKNIQTM